MLDLLSGIPIWGDFWGKTGQDLLQNISRDVFLNVGLKYTNSNRFWDKVERCEAASIKGRKQQFCDENQQLDVDIVSHFGTSKPAAEQYLLHFAPGWHSNRNPVPVLLVHGAGLDATSFADVFGLGFQGLQQQLVELGYRVFAVTFSHPHGDNFFQAEQLADSIIRIRELTGAAQVDVLAHSKGGLASRIYLSNQALTPYRGDVRRYIMLGTPNMGLDFAFRNPMFNFLVYVSGSNGGMAWDRILSMGSMVDSSARAVYGDGSFPGQSQMLYKWDDEHKLDTLQPDWWTTYYGGTGFISHSRGIDTALKDGDFLIEKIDKHGLDNEIEFSVMAGDDYFFNAVPGESAAPSDGIVFVDSVLYTEGLQRKGALLKDKSVMPVNHMELLFSRRVCRWIDRQLKD